MALQTIIVIITATKNNDNSSGNNDSDSDSDSDSIAGLVGDSSASGAADEGFSATSCLARRCDWPSRRPKP